jgi:hypothetical protein
MWITGNKGVLDPVKYNVNAFRKAEGVYMVQPDYVQLYIL